MFEKGQAHRADLTTSRIEDGSREPEMKKGPPKRAQNAESPGICRGLKFFLQR
ncbi:hypothetical protein [Klebsiella pneumoniae ISC21]|nr:hypothetical protein [Klebsiella pneumoniae ISC21]